MDGTNPEDDGPDPAEMERDDPDLGPTRGWIAPDDRLWRHPSEVPWSGGAATAARPRSAPRSGRWIVPVAACVVVALLIGGLLVATSVGSPPSRSADPESTAGLTTPSTEAGSSPSVTTAAAWREAAVVRPSLVALRSVHTDSTDLGTAVVVGPGGLAVTTASLLEGASSVTSIDPSTGSPDAVQIVASDTTSNLAVVRVAGDPPVATFDDDTVAPGRTMVAVALEPSTSPGEGPSTDVYAGAVRTTGTAVDADAATTTLAATTVAMPAADGDLGCPLLDTQGDVVGLMDTTTGTGRGELSVFLPSDLVVGVAHQLITNGTVVHGLLGIDAAQAGTSGGPVTTVGVTTSTSASSAGAVVVSETSDGAAALAGIHDGDVIVAVGNTPVRSLADLHERLYADPPGTTVDVTYVRNGVEQSTSAVLGAGTAAAPPAG